MNMNNTFSYNDDTPLTKFVENGRTTLGQLREATKKYNNTFLIINICGKHKDDNPPSPKDLRERELVFFNGSTYDATLYDLLCLTDVLNDYNNRAYETCFSYDSVSENMRIRERGLKQIQLRDIKDNKIFVYFYENDNNMDDDNDNDYNDDMFYSSPIS